MPQRVYVLPTFEHCCRNAMIFLWYGDFLSEYGEYNELDGAKFRGGYKLLSSR